MQEANRQTTTAQHMQQNINQMLGEHLDVVLDVVGVHETEGHKDTMLVQYKSKESPLY